MKLVKFLFLTCLLLLSHFTGFTQWNSTFKSPVLLTPTQDVTGQQLKDNFNMPPADLGNGSFAFLANDWDLNDGFGLFTAGDLAAPIIWMYEGANNAFTVAKKHFTSGLGQASIVDAMVPLFQVRSNGNVGIGIINPQERLSVNGNIRAKEIRVETTNWPDVVFDKNYKLPTLSELEDYIRTYKHLPGIPDAKDAETDGIDLGEMNRKLLEKIEELTLILIEKDKKINKQDRLIQKFQDEWNDMLGRLTKLEDTVKEEGSSILQK